MSLYNMLKLISKGKKGNANNILVQIKSIFSLNYLPKTN